MRRCSPRCAIVMDPADPLQHPRVKALHPERQTVYPGLTKTGKALRFKGTGVGLERNLGVWNQAYPRPDAGDQALDRLGRQEARSPTAEKDGVYGPPPDHRQRQLKISQHRIHKRLSRNLSVRTRPCLWPRLMRIEVAIRALTHAPRDVHVERQRRKRFEANRPRSRVRNSACNRARDRDDRRH